MDGVCISSSALDPDEARERVAPSPLVVVQPDHERILEPGALPPGTIRTDDRSGLEQAVRHLLVLQEAGEDDAALYDLFARAWDGLGLTVPAKQARELAAERRAGAGG